MRGLRAWVCVALTALVAGCGTLRIEGGNLAEKTLEEMAEEGAFRQAVDYDDYHLRKGRIFLNGGLNHAKAERVEKEIKFAEEMVPVEKITIYLSSEGGDLEAIKIIANTLESCRKPVDIVVTGYCMSGGLYLVQCASGERKAYRNALFGVHAPHGGPEEVKELVVGEVEENLRERTRLPEDFFPLPKEMRFFTAEEALEYGVIDEIVDGEQK
jgi:ATP-dependent Clp protease protease subunit